MTASATQSAPTAIYPPASTLRGVRLTEHIRYLHCDGGDEGGHGVLIFESPAGAPTVVDVETRGEFRAELSALMALEAAFYGR